MRGRGRPGATSTGKPQRWEGEGKREGTSSGRLVLNHGFVGKLDVFESRF